MIISALFLLVSADDAGSALIKQANQVRLDKFLEQFIGECQKGDEEDKKNCRDTAETFRKEAKNKTYVVDIPTSLARSLRPVETKSTTFYAYHFTPFFDGNGYGLTFAKPTPGKDGSPQVKPATLNIPVGDTGEEIFNGLKVDRVTISLVFKPTEVWKMQPKKKGETIYGVVVQPVLLRMEEARSGAVADTVF